MSSTYSTSLRLELMATGDQSGTWGTTTNTNLGTLLEQAITGVLSVAEGDTTLTLTTVNGGSDQARNAVVNLTGAMTNGRNVVVPTANKLYLIKNSTTGGFSTTVKTAAGAGVAVLPGTNRWVYCDGTDVVAGDSNLQTLSLTALSPATNDTLALGTTALGWSDLFLASGGIINWANGDFTLTHATGMLTANGAIVSSGSSVGYTAFQAISTEAAAAAGPVIDLYRNSASPAANDVLGQAIFNGQNSTPAKKEYADISALIVSPTAAAEGGALQLSTILAGTVAPRAVIGAGLYTAGATGGDKGVNTINASTYYKDGGYGVITQGTTVATTSGTTVDFTGLPVGVKMIAIMFNGVSTNGTSNILVQIGSASGGFETTGYSSMVGQSGAGILGTTGFLITQTMAAAYVRMGMAVLSNMTSNTWTQMGVVGDSSNTVNPAVGSGVKTLSSTLDRVRITTVSADTFDLGSVNVAYW